jgi:phage terminase large subunit-like protein
MAAVLDLQAAQARRRQLAELDALGAEIERRKARRKLYTYYPDTGPLRRELYAKHLEFFRAGAEFRERCALSANRVGKTEGMGGYELALHLIGEYPDWWEGKRFDRPIRAWASGKTREKTREIIQEKLFGPVLTAENGKKSVAGTGLIPGDRIVQQTIRWRPNSNEAIESVMIRWGDPRSPNARLSKLTLKSYEMGRGAFEGNEVEVILLDEEPPEDIYNECVIRTMTTQGVVMLTFTPLDGITKVVVAFVDGIGKGHVPGTEAKYTVNAGWDDVPHLSEREKRELLDSTPPHLRDARSKGLPTLGEGLVFPLDEAVFAIDPFEIPDYWPRVCGIDFGWTHYTAVVWWAIDPDTQIAYLYDEYYRAEAEVPIHAAAIRKRGDWIPVAWPRDGLNETAVGPQLAKQYRDEGVAMTEEYAQFEEAPGQNERSKVSVEAGLHGMLTELTTQKIRVFKTCKKWIAETKTYRREKGKVVKCGEDTISASRYGWMMRRKAITQPIEGANRIDWAARKAARTW